MNGVWLVFKFYKHCNQSKTTQFKVSGIIGNKKMIQCKVGVKIENQNVSVQSKQIQN